ncbi:MAG: peptidoglycan DD-metalloendopeptidase family protein [Chloroflexota bacterium]
MHRNHLAILSRGAFRASLCGILILLAIHLSNHASRTTHHALHAAPQTSCQPALSVPPLQIPLDLDKPFGPRLLSNSGTTRYDFHRGIDWDAPNGTPVYAVADGIVKSFRANWASGIGSGNYVHLLHPLDNCETRYNHLAAVDIGISDGVPISRGQLIGWVGDTGAFGDHLHFETREGQQVSQRASINPLRTPFITVPETGAPTVDILAAQVAGGELTTVFDITTPVDEPDVVEITADAASTNRTLNFETLNHETQEVAFLDDPFTQNSCIIPFALNNSNGYRLLIAFHGLDGTAASVTAEATDVVGNVGMVTEPVVGGTLLTPTLQSGEGVPGETAVYNYILTNNTGSNDTFDLEHFSAQGWPAIISPANPMLNDGDSIAVTVTVTVNGTGGFGPPDCGILLATPQSAPEKSGVGTYRLMRNSYVSNSTGSDANDGSQANPFQTISHAIDETAAGGTVHITEGTYQENVTLAKTVHLLGGYSTDWSSRTFAHDNTIIDGNNLGSTLTISGDYGPLIEGFTIKNGLATSGGGVRLSGSAAPTFQNNWVENNTATASGGGIYMTSGTYAPTFLNTVVRNNISQSGSGGGGGIYISGRPVILQNLIVTGNQATVNDGGGIYITGSANVTLLDVDIADNDAADNGGGISLRSASTLTMAPASALPGSALANGTPCQTALLPPNEFCVMVRENSTVDNGGGLYVSTDSQLIAQQMGLMDNTADNGGAIYSFAADDNIALTNSRISGNSGTYALRIWDAATLTAVHTTIADNTGTAVGINNASATVTFDNSILWGNSNGVTSSAPINGSCNTSQDGSLPGGNADPLFTNTPRGSYHLANGSPAIDACGSGESNDLDGLNQPQGANFDQGAFEHCSSPAPVQPQPMIAFSEGQLSLTWEKEMQNELYMIYGGILPYQGIGWGNWETAVSDHSYSTAITPPQNHFYRVVAGTCGGNLTNVAHELGLFHFEVEPGAE